MWYVAFSLGLFGSLHCVGMCGPLAIAFCDKKDDSHLDRLKSGLSYNLGRTFTYVVLGVLFGFLGSFFAFVDLQKSISIILGAVLVFTFCMSYDIDQKINGLPWVRSFYDKLRGLISNLYTKAKSYHPFILGSANGLLPCGLVYLALAGAIATGDVISGMAFMLTFGLGTIPMMLALVLGIKFLSPSLRFKFRKVLPYVTLFFGFFLIYRGLVVNMPEELNFWEMISNPIMCH